MRTITSDCTLKSSGYIDENSLVPKNDITRESEMLKKWKKTIKFLATTIIVLIYVTTGLFSGPTIKDGEDERRNHSPAMRTVIAYSEEYRMRRELEEKIECGDAEVGGGGREEKGWREAPRLGIRVFSAYHDRRQEPFHYVRAVALVKRNTAFYCQLCYKTNHTTTCITHKAYPQEIWSPKWGPKATTCDDFYPAIITCPAPPHNGTVPSRLFFVDKSCSGDGAPIAIRNPQPRPLNNFVVCVKPLNVTAIRRTDLLEWLEINLRLGAEKIVIYGLNASEGGSMVGGHAGWNALEWKEFSTPLLKRCRLRTFEDSVWHKRKMEIIAYNDCFYSNLYYTKFVIPLDVDEIIVPKTGNNWLEAFRSHFGILSSGASWPPDTDNYASFSVRNAYFFSEYPKDAVLKLPKENLRQKLVRTLSSRDDVFGRTLRSYRLSPDGDSVKSFVQVAKSMSVFNHYAFHVLGEGTTRQFIFPENVFQLNHYRNSCDPILIDGCREFLNEVIHDDSLQKFRKKKRSIF